MFVAIAADLFAPPMRSPLRYPGGKSRAVKIVQELVPHGVTELLSPFVGGGSIEIACAAAGMRVHGYDVFKPLVAFWKRLLADPRALAMDIQRYYPLTRDRFYSLQHRHQDEETDLQAVLFFVLNRASFSGTTLSGGCSDSALQERFTQSSIDRVARFQVPNLSVEWADFNEALDRHPHTFTYLDPPYWLKKADLYGNRGSAHRHFDHLGLRDRLGARRGWILSYNNCPEILALYEGFEVLYPDWKYGMNRSRTSKEVLILNR